MASSSQCRLLLLVVFEQIYPYRAGEVAVGAGAVDFGYQLIDREVLFVCLGFQGVPEFLFKRDAGLVP